MTRPACDNNPRLVHAHRLLHFSNKTSTLIFFLSAFVREDKQTEIDLPTLKVEDADSVDAAVSNWEKVADRLLSPMSRITGVHKLLRPTNSGDGDGGGTSTADGGGLPKYGVAAVENAALDEVGPRGKRLSTVALRNLI